MAVLVILAVPSGVVEDDARRPSDLVADTFECVQDRLNGQLVDEGEVEILRKPVVTELAELKRRATLERQMLAKRGPGEANEEPGQAVVPLQYRLWNASSAGAR